MNNLEKQTLRDMQRMIPTSSNVDLLIRTGGQNYILEADFLKKIIMGLEINDD